MIGSSSPTPIQPHHFSTVFTSNITTGYLPFHIAQKRSTMTAYNPDSSNTRAE